MNFDKNERTCDGYLHVFTPYRICPLGAHVDHQLGEITGFAINKGIHINYVPSESPEIRVFSAQFDGVAIWDITDPPLIAVGDWADHLRGATLALRARYPLSRGFVAHINGELPIGGLSSSAAVIISFLSILSKVNGINPSREEMIELALEAENKYVGVSCGRLDQSCEVYCRKNALLHMNLLDSSHELIPEPENMPPYKIAIFFSGLERSLAQSKYNARVDEAKAAARQLLQLSGSEINDASQALLSDVPPEVFDKYSSALDPLLRRRAAHYFSECRRVKDGISAFKRGDIAEFGRLVFESGKSSIEQWETGSEELIRLYEILTETDGVYGGRFSGAGFKGCCMAIIDPEKEDKIISRVRKEYIKAFPHLADRFSAHICETADGIGGEN